MPRMTLPEFHMYLAAAGRSGMRRLDGLDNRIRHGIADLVELTYLSMQAAYRGGSFTAALKAETMKLKQTVEDGRLLPPTISP